MTANPLIIIYAILLLINVSTAFNIINYDDFQMDSSNNFFINGDFQGLKSTVILTTTNVPGWKYRTNNIQIGPGTLYNYNWPANTMVCELVSNEASVIYQQFTLNEGIYLLRFDYATRTAISPKDGDFYVFHNFVQLVYVKPSDYQIRKLQILINAKKGLNTIEFMGIQHVSCQGVNIDNVELFSSKQTNYPTYIQALSVGAAVNASDHLSQNYLLDSTPIDQIQAWCSKTCNSGSWIQISSPLIRQWKSVTTQGRGDEDNWITQYKVLYTLNGADWKYAQNGKIYLGNNDRSTKIVNQFSSLIRAMAIRIVIVSFEGYPCARIGANYLFNQANYIQ